MRERVACKRCGAHRDLAVWSGPCFVCGSGRYEPVAPSPADRFDADGAEILTPEVGVPSTAAA